MPASARFSDVTQMCHRNHIPSIPIIDSKGAPIPVVLHTKCNFINLHASIHFNIHVYVWTYLNFTAPSIWKKKKKYKKKIKGKKHWLVTQPTFGENKTVTGKKEKTEGHLFLKLFFLKIPGLKMSFFFLPISRISLLKHNHIFFFCPHGKNEKIWIYLHNTHFT